MAWLATDRDGTEMMFMNEPEKYEEKGWWFDSDEDSECEGGIGLPKGSIEKLIGRTLTWGDEPVEIS